MAVTEYELHTNPMKKLLTAIAILSTVALLQAQSTFTVNLNGAQDGGGARTGTGSGTLTLNGAQNAITFNNITYSGLSANSTATHIHGPGAVGVSAAVLYNLAPTYSTVGGTSASYNGTLPLVDGTGGFTLAQQIVQLNSGLWYLNVHSTAFGGGEIRGQILPVPEPSVMALAGLGLGGMLFGMRRRKS